MKVNIGLITEDFVKDNIDNVVWLRDDYLSMRGYEKDEKVLAILERVVEVKRALRGNGYRLER